MNDIDSLYDKYTQFILDNFCSVRGVSSSVNAEERDPFFSSYKINQIKLKI